ncbi:MAG: sel1 repeat family protein [Alphaproteobacteria bacterium]|nr:sel1 repeat family protein [Alphaproteobacteria bacterium]MBV9693853.1 sel1 repeat family protein [Alphaproteobacteria bacterium]
MTALRAASAVLLAALATLLWAGVALADFTDGLLAQRNISLEAGLAIWRKAAWVQDDFLSEIQLGDVYGNEAGDNRYFDPVESYVWYFLATHSARIWEHLGDGFARRLVANDFHRALWHEDKLMLLLSPEQREDARNRIVYVLSCRGAEGFLTLGRIHETGVNATFGADLPSDSAAVFGGMSDMAHSYESFRDRSEREFISGPEAQARRAMGVLTASVVLRNDGDALTFFHIADAMGHPLAREYLKGLEGAVRHMRPLGPRIADAAIDKARSWSPPFEFYPPGDSPSGVPYTDECPMTLERQRALVLAERELPPRAAEHALLFLGWAGGPRGVQRFQQTLAETPNGRLSAPQAVRAIQTAAIRGDAPSQNALGVMYAHGVGVAKNYVRAEHWFKKAADQRFGAALYHLGVLYKAGPEGIHQDLPKANDYFTASALAGFRPTMNQLGDLLAHAAERH